MYGLWTPRTPIHLKEIILFIEGKRPNPFCENIESNIKFLSYKTYTNNFTYIEIETDKGKIYVSSFGSILSENLDLLNEFINILKKMFSAGMPVPAIITKDIKPLEINFGENVIDTHKITVDSVEDALYIIMLLSAFQYSSNLINLHRKIWEEVENIRRPTKISLENIIKYKDNIVKYLLHLRYVDTRIEQMICCIESIYYNKYINIKNECLLTLYYIRNLWKKTIEYAERTLEDITTLQWMLHEHELESVRTIAMLYVIVAVGELIVHKPLTLLQFIIFILGALVVALIIHKIIGAITKLIIKIKKEKLALKSVKEVTEEEEATLEMFHLS